MNWAKNFAIDRIKVYKQMIMTLNIDVEKCLKPMEYVAIC